jgi:hypothetical protein
LFLYSNYYFRDKLERNQINSSSKRCFLAAGQMENLLKSSTHGKA